MPALHAPEEPIYDLLIIGGGINGCGIAADAAGRGLRVLLCEQDDLAQHTSSASSKLIHGGLRYLEHYAFRLVREALAEREILLRKAPHLIQPLAFILPHRPYLRPAWMIRAGLFLYDHLAGRRLLPGSSALRFDASSPLHAELKRGFQYFDCRVDDARLVLSNALAAHSLGATILTRTRCVSAQRSQGLWQVQLQDQQGLRLNHRAKVLINAAGPWVEQLLRQNLQQPSHASIRLVQGSHLIVPALYRGEQAYILQNRDGRVVFVIPYLQQFSLIGTTDRDYHGDPAHVSISPEETQYLLDVVKQYFKQPLHAEDVLHSFSGVRALYDDHSGNPAAVTRDYHLERHGNAEEGLLLSVFGGKLTTYRTLAESVLAQLADVFPKAGGPWTAHSPLPGAERGLSPKQVEQQLRAQAPWLPAALAQRWALAYGDRSFQLLEHCQGLADLGQALGAGLFTREVDYLCQHEWAQSAADILWRRSKLGLVMSAAQQQALAQYLAQRRG